MMEIVKFDDVVRRANTKEDRFNTSKIYYVGGDHIESNELMVHDRGIIKGSTIGPMFYFGFKAGDILFVTRNPHLRKSSMVDFEGICSEKTFVLETKDSSRLLQEYLALVMQSDDFWQYCDENKSGGVNYFVNWSTLADYEFALPSLSEQKVLADKLWAAYRVKESYRKLLAATDDMIKAKFVEMFGMVTNNTHNFPVVRVGDVCDCFAGATPSTACPEYWENGNIPWMSSGEVNKKFVRQTDAFITDLGYSHCSTKMVPIHSVVIALAGQGKTRGTVAVNEIELCTNQSLCSMIPNEKLNYLYLFYNLENRYKELRNMAGDASGRGGLNLKIINSILILLPPLDLQNQFALIAAQSEATKASLRQSIESIDRVIKSLINQ